MRSPCLSMAETSAAMMTGKISGFLDAALICLGLSRLTPPVVPSDQLLCFPYVDVPGEGFFLEKCSKTSFSEATSR